MKSITIAILLFSFIHLIEAQEQITNFQPVTGDKSSGPGDFTKFNNLLFFSASTDGLGRELWISNGDFNSATLLKDINIGKASGITTSLSKTSLILNGQLYFIAQDEFSQGEIWRTDGTTNGTIKITDFLNAQIYNLTLVGNKFYFLTKKDDYTLNVWISDGTKTGTNLVVSDLPIFNQPSFQGEINNLFIFTFQPYGSNNSRVWRSDGTAMGTYALTEEIDGNGSGPGGTAALTQYIKHDNNLYFVSRNFLHKTDGTLSGTIAITNLHQANTELANYTDVIEINGKLYFSFYLYKDDRLIIWDHDTSSVIANKIYDQTSSQKFVTSNLINHQNNLFFVGPNPTNGTSLIKLNSNNNSIEYIKELDDGTTIPNLPIFFRYTVSNLKKTNNGSLFCSIPYVSWFGRKGWISEYTTASTTEVPNLADVLDIYNYNGSFFFNKNYENFGRELGKSDGTNAGSFLVDNINKSKTGIKVNSISTLNDKLIFSAIDDNTDEKIWVYENNNLSILKNINPGNSFTVYTDSFILFKDELYFLANNGTITSLWKTDGTPSGTKMAINIELSDDISNLRGLLAVNNGYLYFFTSNAVGENELYRTNGSGKEFIKNLGLNTFNQPNSPYNMVSSGDYIYFTTNAGNLLWVSDGTNIGTVPIKEFSSCSKLTNVNNELYFVASELNGELELWNSSGTESSTKLVKDIGNGYSSEPDHLIAFKNSLYFTAYTTDHGREIWKTTGDSSVAIRISDINSNSTKSSIFSNPSFCALNDELYFKATDGISGLELWKTDGSINGETLVKDINPGMESSSPSELKRIKNLIYFQAYTHTNGIELWKTNGTSEGTIIDNDLSTGVLSSCPTNILATEDNVFFIAEKSNSGPQIWKVAYDNSLNTKNIINKIDWSIFPNPSDGFIYIKSNNLHKKVTIYDLTGKLVGQKTIKNSRVDISKLRSGFYIIKFIAEGKTITKKIIKK